jgi:hypothetical protein
VSLEAALLAGLEHRENTWKQLFSLPIPRWTIYVPKLLVGFMLVCLSPLVLALGIGLEGAILLRLRPAPGGLTHPRAKRLSNMPDVTVGRDAEPGGRT